MNHERTSQPVLHKFSFVVSRTRHIEIEIGTECLENDLRNSISQAAIHCFISRKGLMGAWYKWIAIPCAMRYETLGVKKLIIE